MHAGVHTGEGGRATGHRMGALIPGMVWGQQRFAQAQFPAFYALGLTNPALVS
jgi:hypothetical protein